MVYVPATKLIGPAGLDLPKAEGAVAANGEYGFPIFATQQAVPANLAGSGNYGLLEIDSSGRLYVAGQVAHDAAISGNPFRIGGRARTTDLALVASDDQVDALYDDLGKQIILPYSIPARYQDGVTAAITGTSDTAVIAAPGASLFLNITWVLVTNSHATVGTVVELKSSTTVRARGFAAAFGGGFFVKFPTPLKLASNQAFNAANITTGSNTYVSAGGYISAN